MTCKRKPKGEILCFVDRSSCIIL